MGNLLYIIAALLFVVWLVGIIGFHAGGLFNVLLIFALSAVILRFIIGENPTS